MRNDDAWFVRSPTGMNYRPVRWPGWLLVLGYLVAVAVLSALLYRHVGLHLGLMAILTVGLLVIVIRTSKRQ